MEQFSRRLFNQMLFDRRFEDAWARTNPEEEQIAMNTFERLLEEMPERGHGLHRHIMKCAVCAQSVSILPEEAMARINPAAMMHGARYGEVAEAIAKAYGTACPAGCRRERWSRPARWKQEPLCRETILRRFGEMEARVIMEQSPAAIPKDYREQTRAVLQSLYQSEDILLLGNQYVKRPLYAKAWLERLENGHLPGPLIMPNPLSGKPGKTRDGRDSFRCDSAVRLPAPYLVVEFDDLPLGAQVSIISRLIDADIVDCAVYSGSKSIHCWLRVDAQSEADWKSRVKELHAKLVNYGADPSTANLSRLSRLPGGVRADHGNRIQTLLYLKARPVPAAAQGDEHDADN